VKKLNFFRRKPVKVWMLIDYMRYRQKGERTMNRDRLKIMRITVKIMIIVGIAVVIFGSCVGYTANLQRRGYIQGKINLQYEGTTNFDAADFLKKEQEKKEQTLVVTTAKPNVSAVTNEVSNTDTSGVPVTAVTGYVSTPNSVTTEVPNYRPKAEITTLAVTEAAPVTAALNN
jgi:hypothetical protein